MQVNDPNDIRFQAAKIYTDLASENDEIGVITFSDEATLEHEISKATIENKVSIKKAINGAINKSHKVDASGLPIIVPIGFSYYGGGTNINKPLTLALETLKTQEAQTKKFVIFISDGRQCSLFEKFDPTLIDEFAQHKWPIYTILLSSPGTDYSQLEEGYVPDVDLLKDMAQKTGGQFYRSPKAENLRQIYQKISTVAQGKTNLLATSIKMKSGDIFKKKVQIAPKTIELAYSASWTGSSIKTTFFDPHGHRLDQTKIEQIEEENYQIYKIKNPLPGTWTIVAQAEDMPPEGEIVDFYAQAKIDKIPPQITKLSPLAGQYLKELKFSAQATDNTEIKKIEFFLKRGKSWQKLPSKKKNNSWQGNHYLQSGSYKIKTVAWDQVGNKKAIVVPFVIDNQPPKIKKTKTLNFFWQNKLFISFETKDRYLPPRAQIFIKNDQGKIIKKINLSSKESLRQNFQYSWFGKNSQGKLVAAGSYKIVIITWDRLGNKNKKQIRVYYITLKSCLIWLKDQLIRLNNWLNEVFASSASS